RGKRARSGCPDGRTGHGSGRWTTLTDAVRCRSAEAVHGPGRRAPGRGGSRRGLRREADGAVRPGASGPGATAGPRPVRRDAGGAGRRAAATGAEWAGRGRGRSGPGRPGPGRARGRASAAGTRGRVVSRWARRVRLLGQYFLIARRSGSWRGFLRVV